MKSAIRQLTKLGFFPLSSEDLLVLPVEAEEIEHSVPLGLAVGDVIISSHGERRLSSACSDVCISYALGGTKERAPDADQSSCDTSCMTSQAIGSLSLRLHYHQFQSMSIGE